jgi:hypothetical protein
VSSRMRSARVDLPWSMWAMIEKLRILLWSIATEGSRGADRQPRAMYTRKSSSPVGSAPV